MNQKQLEALIYVSRSGTFKQAAESLYFDSSGEDYITPESLQYRIKQLEQELGVSLYRKRQGSSRVVLTREGQLFLPQAIEVYQRMTEWRGMFMESESAWLTFAATQALLIHRLGPTIAEFRRRHPRLRLRVMNSYAEATEQLVSEGRVDFAFSTRPPEQGELEYVLWKRSNMVLVTPEDHPLARCRSARLEEIAQYPLVLLEPELRGDRELVDEAFRRAGLKTPAVVLESGNSEILLSYVEAGIGITICAETNMLNNRRGLKAIPIEDKIGRTEAGLLVREGQYIPARAREFLSLLDPVFEKWLSEREEPLPQTPAAGPNGRKAAAT